MTFVNKEDETNHFIVLNDPYFVLNHYNCQSENFWKHVKCRRGDADEYKVRDMELFKLNDQNDVEDTRLRDVNAAMVLCVPDIVNNNTLSEDPQKDSQINSMKTNYHIFIVSVKENTARRAYVERLSRTLKAMGAKVDIIDAFYWKTTNVMSLLSEYGITYNAPDNNVSLSQVGCFLSHFSIWMKISSLDDDKRYIILEDDMDLVSDFNFTDLTFALPKDYDMVHLWKHPAQASLYDAHHVKGQSYSTYYPQWGATAYIITPHVSQIFVKELNTIYAPLDDMLMKDTWKYLRRYIMSKDYFTTGRFPSIILGHDSVNTLDVSSEKNALCLLCVTPNPIWLDFLATFTNYTLYIMVDKQDYDLTDVKAKYPMIQFLQIPGNICKALGYNDSNTAVYPAYVTIAWDKAIYYFSERNTIHPHVWLVEEDVFFYNEQTLTDLDAKHSQSDLVISPTTDRSWDAKQPWDWHWCNIPFDDTLVTYNNLLRGMVCGARMSNQLFKLCANYAQKNKQRKLMYIETLFPSLAKHNGLQIATPDELKEITWNTKWTEKFPLTSGHMYHPMKDIGLHKTLRDTPTAKN